MKYILEMEKDLEFNKIIDDIICNETVLQMKNYIQHFHTTCFDHCKTVAYYSYLMCKKLGLDYNSAARAGMLHDLFLYDWRKPRPDGKGLHGFRHPRLALNNATKLFKLNKIEQDIILKHMWPLTIKLPKYKESYVITIADKYVTLLENKNYIVNRKFYCHAYLFLSMLFIKLF